jgi:hypothetical protein
MTISNSARSSVPLWAVVEALVLLGLHCAFVLPFELLRAQWRKRSLASVRASPNLLQDVAYSIVRLAFGESLDLRSE